MSAGVREFDRRGGRRGASRGPAARLALVAILGAAAHAAPPQRGRASADVPELPELHRSGLREAFELARARHVPVVVVAVLEDAAEDVVAFREGLYDDRELAGLSRHVVLVVSNNGWHEPESVERTVDGETVVEQRCPAYRTPTCDGHRAAWQEIYVQFQEDGDLHLPQVVLLRPDHTIVGRINNRAAPAVSTVVRQIEAALEDVGEGLTQEGLAHVRRLQAEAARQTEAKRPALAWKAWNELLERTGVEQYAGPARAARDQALAAVDAARDEAVALAEAGEAVEGWRRLVALAEDARETPRQRDLDKDVRAVEREHKDAIRAWEREREAAGIEREIEALLAAGDERKAASLGRRLLRAFEDTEAAARVRRAHPDWGS